MTGRQFQLRYEGGAAPDPETLAARDVLEARDMAAERFKASGVARAVLWSNGAVLHVFDVEPPEGPEDRMAQLLAAAGIYVFRSPTVLRN